MHVTGTKPDCNFRDRLKNVKAALREWSKNKYGSIGVELESWKSKATELESKADQGIITADEHYDWMNARAKWLQKENEVAEMLKQKSRLKWAEEGDDNTAFFHSTIRRNNNSNLRGLYINGSWEENPTSIKEEVHKYFSNIFDHRPTSNPDFESLGVLNFSSLSHEDAMMLEAPILEYETWNVIKESEASKAPGPDGFNLGFSTKWITWIKACLDSASVSILVNGSPTKEFSLKRGIRQGDPLSPYLFIIVAEALNKMIKRAIEVNMFKGPTIGKDNVMISHLQYADDTILFGE
ncbi:uncharacterized protein [Rutidosis leptorrhynchoides]|uniref:uncharacterized protein n=1 Tax=Rutidosis leptorrhynchoides TaxID=125765 RepID=UPI003A995BB9